MLNLCGCSPKDNHSTSWWLKVSDIFLNTIVIKLITCLHIYVVFLPIFFHWYIKTPWLRRVCLCHFNDWDEFQFMIFLYQFKAHCIGLHVYQFKLYIYSLTFFSLRILFANFIRHINLWFAAQTHPLWERTIGLQP